jgi:acyl-CoA synthetase (NDP forming)
MDHQTTNMFDALQPIVRAEHVAIVGASATAGKAGNRVIKNLRMHGYEGRISPVNPAGGEIEGLPCYPTVSDIPGVVDCAIILTPLGAVVDAVRDCATAGARACCIGAVGFAEVDTEEGRARQQAIEDAANAVGMRIIGPNTNGYLNRDIGLALGYNTSHGEPILPGVISVAAHTGALFTHFARILSRFRVGISKFISVGNEADLNILDCFEYFLEDDNSKVIGLIIEGIDDGTRFRSLLERAQAQAKPVVVLKLGRSKAGAGASLAHATRLAGNGQAYDALFAHTGVATVPSIEAFAGGCMLLAQRTPETLEGDQRLVCVSSSGAGAAMLADLADARDMPMAVGPDGNWDAEVADALTAVKTNQVLRNPLDTGSLGGQGKIADVFDVLLAQSVSGPTIGFTHTVGGNEGSDVVPLAFIERKDRTGSPSVMISPSGLVEAVEDLYIDNGIPVFSDTATAFDALRCHYLTLPTGRRDAQSANAITPRRSASLGSYVTGGHPPLLDELQSSQIFRDIGLPVVASHVVTTQSDAVSRAAEVGYPVVLKALAPGVAHKNDLGFVAAGLSSPRELKDAFGQMRKAVKAQGFGPRSIPYILQPMVAAKAELILGIVREVGLGHFLLVGLGGIYAEALNETILLPTPIARADMEAQIAASRIGRVLSAVGGEESSVTSDLLDALDALQGLLAAHGDEIEAVDVNPFILSPSGCLAVDALVVLADNR